MRHTRDTLLLFTAMVLIVALPVCTAAQTLSGVVREVSNARAVAGAVIELVDSSGLSIVRVITNADGSYRVGLRGPYVAVVAKRLGFRPSRISVPRSTQNITLDINLRSLATLLDAVDVSEQSSCPRRDDSMRALALWEQAKAALLATLVSQSATPESIRIIEFQRVHDGTSDRIAEQYVKRVSGHARSSFQAASAAGHFVRDGFMTTASGTTRYFAPDASVLLDEDFTKGYCFSLRSGDRSRKTQVGLAFVPQRRLPGIVGIEGTLWVDTLKRALVDVAYTYQAEDSAIRRLRPGGSLTFGTWDPSRVYIDRWLIRMPQRLRAVEENAMTAVSASEVATSAVPTARYRVIDGGGELVLVRSPDGAEWRAQLGTLQAPIVDQKGNPLSGVTIRLANTDYVGISDSSALVTIQELLPGPYRLDIIDSTLAKIALPLQSSVRFVAERDVTYQRPIEVETASDHVEGMCKKDGVFDRQSLKLIARVYGTNQLPIPRAQWEFPRAKGVTASDGVFVYCQDLELGKKIPLKVSDGVTTKELTIVPSQKLTVLKIVVP